MSDKTRSTGGIFTVRDGKLVGMTEQPFAAEKVLQKLLADYPGLLAGDQGEDEEPRRWLLVTREMAVPGEQDGLGRWSLDHLFVDQEGVPTLVEVKRGTDTRIRREVVGQMLDYAANSVAYWPVENIISRFESRCKDESKDPEAELDDFLGATQASEAFWQRVKTNLQAGRIRLIFVADEIPRELRRIVEFLNEQMDPAEVLALEVKKYGADRQEVFVGRVIGQTAEAEQKKRPGGRAPTLVFGAFLKDVSKRVNEYLSRQGSPPVRWRASKTEKWEQTCSSPIGGYTTFVRLRPASAHGLYSLVYCLEHNSKEPETTRALDRHEEDLRAELKGLPRQPQLDPPEQSWRKLRYQVDGIDAATLGQPSTVDEAARCLSMFVNAHRLLVRKIDAPTEGKG